MRTFVGKPVYTTVTFACLVYCVNAGATNLVEVYVHAEASDPVYKESIAAYNATLDVKPQVQSPLLPLIDLSADTI